MGIVMKNKLKNIMVLYVMLIATLSSTLIAKNKKDKHPTGGHTLTLVNETSFTLDFSDPFHPQDKYTSLSDLFAKLFEEGDRRGHVISDLPPNGKHTEDFGDFNYGEEGTQFKVLSAAWPRGKELIVTIPKPEGPNLAPFWDEEHEIFGTTIAVDYNVEWSDKNKGWVITFFEEERLTAFSSKGPSPEVEALRNRIKLKEKMKSRASGIEL